MISVIVPVYKVEKELDRCILSVVNQSYPYWELILVNDGSPDNCPKICDRWALKDPRIKVIHKSNGGQSSARNKGLQLSRGQWIYFLDSDDYIQENCFELFINTTRKYPDIDFVYAGSFASNNSLGQYDIKKKNLPDYINKVSIVNQFFLAKVFDATPWNKLIRKDFIIDNKLYFVEGCQQEDELWIFMMSKFAKRVAVVQENTYNYTIREGSTMNGSLDVKRNWIFVSRWMIDHIGGRFAEREVSAIFYNIQYQIYHNSNNDIIKEHIKSLGQLSTHGSLKQKFGINLYRIAHPWLRAKLWFIRLVYVLVGNIRD